MKTKKAILTAPHTVGLVIERNRKIFEEKEIGTSEIFSIFQSLLSDLSEVIRSIQNRGVCCTEVQDSPAEDVLRDLQFYFTPHMLHDHICRMEDIIKLVDMREDFKYICEKTEVTFSEE